MLSVKSETTLDYSSAAIEVVLGWRNGDSDRAVEMVGRISIGITNFGTENSDLDICAGASVA